MSEVRPSDACPAPGNCCDLHGRNCEPPSELCCDWCTEAGHTWRTTPDDPYHCDGTPCSNPDLSGMGADVRAGWGPMSDE